MNKTFTVKNRLYLLLITFSICLLSFHAQSQQNVYVDSGATGANNGSSWANAYTKLSDALTAVNAGTAAVQVHVASGTYFPTGVQSGTDRDSAFTIYRAGIRLLGGYPRGGGVRNPSINKVYLDGDIGTVGDAAGNSFHIMVVVGSKGIKDSTVIDGFAFLHGKGADELDPDGKYYSSQLVVYRHFGGGLLLERLSIDHDNPIAVNNCEFTNNASNTGGGVYANNAAVIFNKCTFSSGTAIRGAGVGAINSSSVFNECVFSDNKSYKESGLAAWGGETRILNSSFLNNETFELGGVASLSSMSAEVNNCLFTNNYFPQQGGSLLIFQVQNVSIKNSTFSNNNARFGAGMFVRRSNGNINNCKFLNNTSAAGGAIYIEESTISVNQATAAGNNAEVDGGVIYSVTSTITINGGTYSGNKASRGGGVLTFKSGSVTIDKGLFSENAAQYGGVIRNEGYPQLYVKNAIFSRNKSTNTAPVMSLAGGAADSLINNLFIQNKDNSTVGGGAICLYNGNYFIANNTFYADTTNGRGSAVRLEGTGGSCNLRNNLFYKCKAASGTEVYNDAAMPYTESNNSFSVNPVFKNEASPAGPDNTWGTADDGLVVSGTTPLANAGDTAGIGHIIPSFDIAGNPRIVGNQIDIGAYESTIGSELYVDSTYGNDANDGNTWATAYKTLSRALSNNQPVMSIYVAKGTYYPSGVQAGASRDSAFTILRGNIKLYGGYPAGGGVRDIANNPVYLDGNIRNTTMNTDNSYHIMVVAGLPATADSVIIDGFTFRNGNANGDLGKKYNGFDVWQYYGGALVLQDNAKSKKIKIINCVFTNNLTRREGAAVYTINTDPVFENCRFDNNQITSGGIGGAIQNYENSVVFTNCEFIANNGLMGAAINNINAQNQISGSRFDGNNGEAGGAIANSGNSTATIHQTQFNNNTALLAGGAIYQEGGTIHVAGSVFTNNSAEYGGAIRNQSNPVLSVKNSVFNGNSSNNTGAAMSLAEGSDTLVNNLFIRNKDNSAVGGGAICLFGGNFSVVNNTFYADTTMGSGGAIRLEGGGGNAKLQNNIFYKCKATTSNDVYNDAGMPLTELANSYSIDPLFINEASPIGADNIWGTADDGLVLQVSSTEANTGYSLGFESFMPFTDLSGNTRIFGDAIDKGAYESLAMAANILYVDSTNGNDGNSGASWALAHKTLARALHIVNKPGNTVDSILVAKGTYFPTGQQNGTNRDSSFIIYRAGLKLYGGYPAGGGIRDLPANPVYLDGNINNPDDNLDNSFHVLMIVDTRLPADSLVLDGFTIRNGNADGSGSKINDGYAIQRNSGGGAFVLFCGAFTRFSNCNFINNTVNREGAGIYNNNASPLISNCNFSDNRSTVDGGAMYNCFRSSPIVLNCSFTSNIAMHGAGIYNIDYSNAVIRKTNFLKNKTTGDGGGIYNNVKSVALIDSCIISENSSASGAGIYNRDYSNAVIKNTQITLNTAISDGGGIMNILNSAPQIDSCIISGNIAEEGGGMQNFLGSNPVIRNTSFIQNKASTYGGGIYNIRRSSPQLDSCLFSENTATFGAGIANRDTSAPAIRNSRFSKNAAITDGGGIYNTNLSAPLIYNCIIAENTAKYGAGMYNYVRSSPIIRSNSIMQNQSVNDGAGVYNNYESSPQFDSCLFSGNISQQGGGGMINSYSSHPVIRNCKFIGNRCTSTGGAIQNMLKSVPVIDSCYFAENSARYGGAIYTRDSSLPVFKNSQFTRNTASSDGGAIHTAVYSSPLIDSCLFSENTATYGGGLYCINFSSPVVRNSQFIKDTARNDGGGIFVRSGSNPALEKCVLSENVAKRGGALFGLAADMPVTGCSFEKNLATEGGGAIFQYGGHYRITTSRFSGNSAQYGGAIRNEQPNKLSVKNSIFELNSSTNTGAAMSLFQGTDTLVNNIFIRNKDNSNVGGGAICIASGTYSIINNTFYADSTINGSGGAIRLEPTAGYASVCNNIFHKCHAGAGDKDIFESPGFVLNKGNNHHTSDPGFINENDPDGVDNTWGTADDGLALAVCSPAINAGKNEWLDAATVTDITTQARIRLGSIDLGAYESNNAFSLNEASATLPADNICSNDGWINYYNTSGGKILVAIKPGANDLGTITAVSNLRTGYGTNATERMTAPFGNANNFYPFNRSWSITSSKAPVDSVGVRFYFGTADSSDVINTVAFNSLSDLILYKVNGNDAWNAAATGYSNYTYADTASKTTFTLGRYQGLLYAEFYVTSFSTGSMAMVASSPLPLDLLNFTGRLINDNTKLQWTTTNEVNVSHFEVERSNNNNSWMKVGKVAARNNAGDQLYELWDHHPVSGWNYYRLKMVDIDGRFKYSKIVPVRTNRPSLLIYPNPNKGQFTVEIDNAARMISLQLLDASGRIVHVQRLVHGSNQINVGRLIAGVYVLKIEDGTGSHVERMIITK